MHSIYAKNSEANLYSDLKPPVSVKRPKDAVSILEGLGKEVWETLEGADVYIRKERASWKR